METTGDGEGLPKVEPVTGWTAHFDTTFDRAPRAWRDGPDVNQRFTVDLKSVGRERELAISRSPERSDELRSSRNVIECE